MNEIWKNEIANASIALVAVFGMEEKVAFEKFKYLPYNEFVCNHGISH